MPQNHHSYMTCTPPGEVLSDIAPVFSHHTLLVSGQNKLHDSPKVPVFYVSTIFPMHAVLSV